MAEITSGEVTVFILSPGESEALCTVLTDWYNIMRESVANGDDPHGYTQETGNALMQVASALGVDADLTGGE